MRKSSPTTYCIWIGKLANIAPVLRLLDSSFAFGLCRAGFGATTSHHADEVCWQGRRWLSSGCGLGIDAALFALAAAEGSYR
jgi:hypothetical protein